MSMDEIVLTSNTHKRSQSNSALNKTDDSNRPVSIEKRRSYSSDSMIELQMKFSESIGTIYDYDNDNVFKKILTSAFSYASAISDSISGAWSQKISNISNNLTFNSLEAYMRQDLYSNTFDYGKHHLVELIINAPMVLAFGSYEGTFVTYHEDQDMHRADMFTSTTNGDWDFSICLLRRSHFMSREQLDDNYVDEDEKRSEIRVETEIGIKDVLERLEAHLELNIGYFKSNSQYLTAEFDMNPKELEEQQGRTKLLNRVMNKLMGSPHRDVCTVQNFKLISTRASGSYKATAESGDNYVLFSREF